MSATKTISFNLPMEVITAADEANLLTDQVITELLLDALKRRAGVDRFMEIARRLQAVEPKLTLEEIQAEIDVTRL